VYLEESPEPSAANRQAPKVFTSFVVRAFCARRCGLSHVLNPWIGQPRRRSLPSHHAQTARAHSRRRLSRHTVPLPPFRVPNICSSYNIL
jgi:hypothetical protein